jgi:hypothetical protein
MKNKLASLAALLLLSGCFAITGQQPAPDAAATDAPAPPPAAAAGNCPNAPPWTRASQALGQPVVESTSATGKPVFAIKRVSYASIVNDHDLLQGVKLTDPRGQEPAPATLYNIVWNPEEVSCTARYSAPTFFDVR